MEGLSPNFGILIAFVLPGFLALWGVAQYSDIVRGWLAAGAGIGGFLFVLLASLAVGVFLTAVRFATLDKAYAWCGLVRGQHDFARQMRPDMEQAFMFANENYFRYYEFYAHTFLATLIAYVAWLAAAPSEHWPWVAPHPFVVAVLALGVLLIAATDSVARTDDALASIAKYASESTE